MMMMMMQKITSVAATLAFLAAHAQAQITYDVRINSYRCPTSGGVYCLGASLEGTIIVRCKDYIGTWRNCKFQNLFYLPPRGPKVDALCYQPEPAVGDAACVWNGTVYPDNRAPFPFHNGSTIATPSAASKTGLNVPSVTVEAAFSTDINGPSQPLRNCTDSEKFPEFPLEGICTYNTSSTASVPRTTSSTSSTPRITLEAVESPDINEPSQPLRDCIGSENSPDYELEGICHVTVSLPQTTISGTPVPLASRFRTPTTSGIQIPQTTFKSLKALKTDVSPDINGPSQPLRDCIGSENSPDYELEGICHVTVSLPQTTISGTPVPLASRFRTPTLQATSSRTRIPQTTFKALKAFETDVSPDINGPSQPLRDCTEPENFPEYELEGICHVTKSSKAKREPADNDASHSSTTKAHGTATAKSNPAPAATTVTLSIGSANTRGAWMSIVGAELLALTLFFFLLAN